MDVMELSDEQIEAYRLILEPADLELAVTLSSLGEGRGFPSYVREDAEALSLSLADEVEVLRLAKIGKLNRSPKSNWVEEAGGLPAYIEDIAHSLHTKRGFTISRAIATAVSMVKRWARGGEDVNADTRLKAAKAVAQWEALKAKNKLKKAFKKGD